MIDIEAENLRKRCGSIQAAINLELEDLNLDNLELKIEGVNGKLPNLDLFNTIFKLCQNIQFKCALSMSTVLKQANGLSTSLHEFFTDQRIELLAINGGKPERIHRNEKHFKQNILKLTRLIHIFFEKY